LDVAKDKGYNVQFVERAMLLQEKLLSLNAFLGHLQPITAEQEKHARRESSWRDRVLVFTTILDMDNTHCQEDHGLLDGGHPPGYPPPGRQPLAAVPRRQFGQ
jgi:hypothetical protein